MKNFIVNVLIWMFTSTITGSIIFAFVAGFSIEKMQNKKIIEEVFLHSFILTFVAMILYQIFIKLKKRWRL